MCNKCDCALDYIQRRRAGGKYTREVEHLQRLYKLSEKDALTLLSRLGYLNRARAAASDEFVNYIDNIEKEIREAFGGRGVRIAIVRQPAGKAILARIGGASLKYDSVIDTFYVDDGFEVNSYADLYDALSVFELIVREQEVDKSTGSTGSNEEAEAEEYSAAEKRKISTALRTTHRAGKAKRVKSTAKIVEMMAMFDKIQKAAKKRGLPLKSANAIAASQTRKKYGKSFDQAVSIVKASRR